MGTFEIDFLKLLSTGAQIGTVAINLVILSIFSEMIMGKPLELAKIATATKTW